MERVGQTAIGLVKLLPNIIFSNRFLGIEGSAKSLLPSGQIKQYNTFLIDSFVTGQQKLRFEGIRVRLPPSSRGKDFQLPPKTDPSKIPLPPPGTYVSVHQVYATSEPMIKGQPKIREGVCGSALVRSTTRLGAKLSSVVDKGEIAGFMHFSNLVRDTRPSNILCYCDSVDELIDDGWSVVQVPDKRKKEEE